MWFCASVSLYSKKIFSFHGAYLMHLYSNVSSLRLSPAGLSKLFKSSHRSVLYNLITLITLLTSSCLPYSEFIFLAQERQKNVERIFLWSPTNALFSSINTLLSWFEICAQLQSRGTVDIFTSLPQSGRTVSPEKSTGMATIAAHILFVLMHKVYADPSLFRNSVLSWMRLSMFQN